MESKAIIISEPGCLEPWIDLLSSSDLRLLEVGTLREYTRSTTRKNGPALVLGIGFQGALPSIFLPFVFFCIGIALDWTKLTPTSARKAS
jgi:hypothetical protein